MNFLQRTSREICVTPLVICGLFVALAFAFLACGFIGIGYLIFTMLWGAR